MKESQEQEQIEKRWKDTQSSEDALELVKSAVLIEWKEMKAIKKQLSEEDQLIVIRNFAKYFIQNINERVMSEIYIENILVWISATLDSKHLQSLFNEIFSHDKKEFIIKSFVEISLTADIANKEFDEKIYSMAIIISCELGIAVKDYQLQSSESIKHVNTIIDHISTHLLSVSNHNNISIRLSLLHYFGQINNFQSKNTSFNRIMHRFGHTLLDHIFHHLFNKKSEAISLQYLMNNLPFVLEADSNSQRILQEILRFYLLKKPERFILFIQTFSDHLLSINHVTVGKKIFLQHIVSLFSVSSEVNHRGIGGELVQIMEKFSKESFYYEILELTMKSDDIRNSFKMMLSSIYSDKANNKFKYSFNMNLHRNKRGRKPSFSKSNLDILGQVTYLSELENEKAS